MVHGLRSGKLMVQRISDDDLLADVQRVYREYGSATCDTYRAHGKHSQSCVSIRFGVWRNVLRRAGIQTDRSVHHPGDDEADFDPIEKPKARKCLQCGVAIISINYTCGRCYLGNSTTVLADGWEVVAG